MILGDNHITALRCNTQTISALSDARDKTDVEPSIRIVIALEPSLYVYPPIVATLDYDQTYEMVQVVKVESTYLIRSVLSTFRAITTQNSFEPLAVNTR